MKQIKTLRITEQSLTPETYCKLRKKVNFQPYLPEDAAVALARTLYSAEVKNDEETIGIARIVGDGRIVFFIKDVVVDPEYHGMGIGRMLMDALFSYIDRHACPFAYVGLMTTPGTEEFYEKFGFIRRPTNGLGHGMVLFTQPSRSAKKPFSYLS